MPQPLRQSTQVVRRVGPFVDATDAVSPETGITLGAADQAEALKAAGAGTVDISGATWAAVTGCDGWYDLTLTTSHTDTVGDLTVVVQDSSVCLPVFTYFIVIEEAVYDALYASGAAGPLQSTVAGRTLDVSATGEAGVDWANVGSQTTSVTLSGTTVGTTTTNTDMRGTEGAALATAYTAARAGYLDNINGHTAQTGDSYARIGAAGASLTDLGGMSSGMQGEVNAEVLDVLSTDTFAEPGQEAPGATISIAGKIGYLFKAWRNRSTQTATTYSLYNDDATTVDQKATVSDDTTTADKGEVGTGP